MRITLRDVAKAAGVSPMAVSSVLHGTGRNVRVAEETAEKIRQVADELKYLPNSFARSLRSRRTRMVGVVFQHLQRFHDDNPYYPQLLNGIMAALFKADYTLALCPKLVQNGDIGAMLDGRFDGVLWARPDFTEANVLTLRAARVPLVMMHAPPGSAEGISTFCADNEGAMRQVVGHLGGLGHQRIAYVVNEVDAHTAEGRVRSDSFLLAMQEAGLRGESFIWDESPNSLEKYRQTHRDFTAYVCFSDTLAGHLLSACRSLGLNVPRDISVTGFDSSPFCERTTPRLTSVYQPVEKIAYEATTHLLKLIEARTDDVDVLVNSSTLYACGLDVRDSTCPPSLQKKSL